jgi:hypothetical protein
MNGDEFRRAMAAQQAHFDVQMMELRLYYQNSCTPEKRAAMRSWLERVYAITKEGLQLDFSLHPTLTYEKVNDQGETVDVKQWAFSARTYLDAIKAWDAGELYDPKIEGVPP